MRVAGIMSGTSLDGIDVAVVDIRGTKVEVVKHHTVPYTRKMRDRILGVSNCEAHVSELTRLHFALPELYAKALRGCDVPFETIELIGCHGQTVFHEAGATLQLGDGSVLAERTGIPVVSDFRPRDIAAGGQGAPLVPFVDYLLFRHRKLGRVVLNIGGIANITTIPPNAQPEGVLAFDTGPGNMVVDQLISIYSRGKLSYDKGGKIAASGVVRPGIVDRLLHKSYYTKPPPKSAGREQYGQEFIKELRQLGVPILDLIATVTAFTPAAIRVGIQRFAGFPVDELIVSGGGVHNATMMAYLQAFLPDTKVRTTAEFGIDPDAKEAVAFAILAHETWRHRPSNLPTATGASRAVILGKISF